MVVSANEGDMSTNLQMIGFFGNQSIARLLTVPFPTDLTGCYFDNCKRYFHDRVLHAWVIFVMRFVAQP